MIKNLRHNSTSSLPVSAIYYIILPLMLKEPEFLKILENCLALKLKRLFCLTTAFYSFMSTITFYWQIFLNFNSGMVFYEKLRT